MAFWLLGELKYCIFIAFQVWTDLYVSFQPQFFNGRNIRTQRGKCKSIIRAIKWYVYKSNIVNIVWYCSIVWIFVQVNFTASKFTVYCVTLAIFSLSLCGGCFCVFGAVVCSPLCVYTPEWLIQGEHALLCSHQSQAHPHCVPGGSPSDLPKWTGPPVLHRCSSKVWPEQYTKPASGHRYRYYKHQKSNIMA